MPSGWTRCQFCGKKIFSIYAQRHYKECRVRRGLDKRKPLVKLPDNPTQTTFDMVMNMQENKK